MKNRIIGSILLLTLLFFTSSVAQAQGNTIESLRCKANTLRKEIKEKETILMSSQKDINGRLNILKIITAKIGEYKSIVDLLQKEVGH